MREPQGTVIDHTRAMMMAAIQASGVSQVDIGEHSLLKVSGAEIRTAEAGTTQVGTEEIGTV